MSLHTPERLPNESQADYRKRRLASRAEVRRMCVIGADGLRAALRDAYNRARSLGTLFGRPAR